MKIIMWEKYSRNKETGFHQLLWPPFPKVEMGFSRFINIWSKSCHLFNFLLSSKHNHSINLDTSIKNESLYIYRYIYHEIDLDEEWRKGELEVEM